MKDRRLAVIMLSGFTDQYTVLVNMKLSSPSVHHGAEFIPVSAVS
jgi:hypothetical protein